ncbi:hypothetical protein BCV69DRAFT_284656 [Microstroma glucosiphilum]|uniref:SET domain-containing protein n=1 Tax=Pseudomicrostroma glucosiphilum TaxID=1684307 RepID=A0A316U7W8_9BASI|nr:hypothetical protein BCV69DRAFT_284656 [Pseudomicrostroma glucosiphilum]PWN19055.1 hypothetical protein BCV69DRAFT_284656 [Pseudomicrostroma glucosiphilum]
MTISTPTTAPTTTTTPTGGKAKYSAHLSNGDPTILSTSYIPTHPHLFLVHFSPGDYNSSLVTQRPFARGETLAYMDSAERAPLKRYSTVQVGEESHIELNSDLLYINHSCDPSVRFEVGEERKMWRAVAERDIQKGEALSFFYPSTEWSMAQPFKCNCNSSRCLGTISGAKDIDAQTLLEGYFVNEHIRRLKEAQSKEEIK